MLGEGADAEKTTQSVETSLTVLNVVADALDRSKASIHHHLSTFRRGGYPEQVDRKYRLADGLVFLSLGGGSASASRSTTSRRATTT